MAIFFQEVMMIQKSISSFNRKRLRSALLSALLVSILGIGFILIAPRSLRAQVPDSVAACIPDRIRKPVGQVNNIANYAFEGETYYLLGLLEEGEPADAPPVLLVVKTAGQDCQEVFFNPGGESVQLAASMPLTVARRLTLGLYEREIAEIGREKFQADLVQSASSRASVTWSDEEIWALKQLGISIPSNVQTAPLPSPTTSP
jgi:hypothetical protein